MNKYKHQSDMWLRILWRHLTLSGKRLESLIDTMVLIIQCNAENSVHEKL